MISTSIDRDRLFNVLLSLWMDAGCPLTEGHSILYDVPLSTLARRLMGFAASTLSPRVAAEQQFYITQILREMEGPELQLNWQGNDHVTITFQLTTFTAASA